MGFLIRIIVLGASAVAGIFIARDAPNFGIVEAMIELILIALAVGALAAWRRD